MKKKLIAGFAALAIAAAAAAALLQPARAPEVRFATLSGETLATSDLRGKVLLVNFWATWCTSCVAEMPKMAETYRKFAPRGYEMIAVAIGSEPNQVAAFAANRALPFKVALDGSGEIAKDFGDVRITPTSFLVDRDGRIVKKYLGEPDWQEFHALVEKTLAGS